MKKRHVFLFLGLTILLSSGAYLKFGSQQSQQAIPAETSKLAITQPRSLVTDKTLVDEVTPFKKFGFKIAPPKGWNTREAEDGFGVILSSSPKSTNYPNPNTILIQTARVVVLNAEMPITKILETTRNDMSAWPRRMNLQVLYDGQVNLTNGTSAHMIEYTYVNPETFLPSHAVNLFIGSKSKNYILGVGTDQNEWQGLQKTYESFLSSIELIDVN